jgi:peptidoglycan/LPS O-acetylase OafA/YrhL
MARRRLEELSILNVLFCMLVVLIHVLSHAVGALDRTGWQYALVLIPQRLAFVSVPGFFFLSGLKLTLPRGEESSLTAYYLGRVKRLLLPYLLADVSSGSACGEPSNVPGNNQTEKETQHGYFFILFQGV